MHSYQHLSLAQFLPNELTMTSTSLRTSFSSALLGTATRLRTC
jgi:hypothetical protein